MNTELAPVQQGISLRADPDAFARKWRGAFVNDATIKTLSQIQKTSVAEIRLANKWPDRSAELIVRAPTTPLKQGDYPGTSVARLMLLAPRSAMAQLAPLVTVIDLVGVSSYEFFPSPTNFAVAQFVAEGQPIAVRQGAFVGMPVGPVRKLALISALSGELESASGGVAEAAIANTLEVAVGRGGDAVLLSANPAVVDVAPAGLLFNVAPITGSTDMVKDLSALIASISAAGIDTASVVFVCAPPQALAISLVAGPHFTHRLIEAGSLAAGTVIAIATSALVFAGDGANPQIETSKQAVLHMSDAPAQLVSPAGVVAAPTQSMFQTDTLALRCTSMITWSAAPGSVAVVNGATW